MSKYQEIRRRFEAQADKHKELGSYQNLCHVIVGRNYGKQDLAKAFKKLVNKDEYDYSERKEYIDYLSTI